MAVSIGQITIMDFNDGVTLTGFISSNHTKNVKYDGNNELYSPDFTDTPLVLTPSLFVAGSGSDIMSSGTNVQSVTWKRKANNQTGENNLSTIVYRDPATGLDLTYKNSVTIQKVTEGNNIAIAEITADPGFAFKNNQPVSITLAAHLYRAATKDTTNLTYVWERLVGGTWTLISGATGATYAVTGSSVASLQQFRVKISDTVVGDTYTSDPVTVLDFNDPIQVVIESTGGMVFKNGEGTSTLKAKLFQNGVEIDATGSNHTYTWSVLDKDGTAREFADASASKTGKTISVGTADVEVKSTFICTVS